jgi:hypothetical protein
LKTKNDKSNSFEKLQAYLAENDISVEQAIDRLEAIKFDPAKDFYATLVSASREIIEKVRNKTLDFETSGYDKSLFMLLQTGDKINKSMKLARLEAYPEEEPEDEDGGYLDRMRK